MVQPIRFNPASFTAAVRLAQQGTSDVTLVRGLGSATGLSREGQSLLLSAGSASSLQAIRSLEIIRERLEEVDSIDLARRLAPNLSAQLTVEGFASADGGFSPGQQVDIIAGGLSSTRALSRLRGASVDSLI